MTERERLPEGSAHSADEAGARFFEVPSSVSGIVILKWRLSRKLANTTNSCNQYEYQSFHGLVNYQNFQLAGGDIQNTYTIRSLSEPD